MINPQRAQEIVQQFTNKRIIVLGDFMVDEFIWGDVRRISPEAPVPVVEVKRESWHAGGAGNVVSNLLSLGAKAIPIGVIGKDWAGEKLCEQLREAGADTTHLIEEENRPTTLKTRIIAHHQQMIRADRESKSPIQDLTEKAVINAFTIALKDADAVVISDYDKGVLTPTVLQQVLAVAGNHIVCLDPKLKNFSSYRPLTVITPNQHEAERATGIEINNDESLIAAARQIREMLDCPYVLITRGEHGMSLLNQNLITHIPAVARDVFDVTGAGDTVIATLTLALAANADIQEAAIIANYAAGFVVGKVGTATISRSDLLNQLSLG
ncbi:MAG: D-glycero-beta-D-manno-heptose-7-phosphate kinase [Acidobacteria bacterium]|nr:D-glycero-beta-D-manno-heptose-7-phosphate kinase [Acidobacteriota bacterium]